MEAVARPQPFHQISDRALSQSNVEPILILGL